MKIKRICFIAQFPPPIHGLSKAVDTLYNSNLNLNVSENGEFDFSKIDIKNNKHFFKSIIKIINSNADAYYFTISQSRGGNLRDIILLEILKLKKAKCILHLHGGYYRKLIDEVLPKWQKKLNYTLIKDVDAAIVLSESLKNIFHGMIDDEKIYVVENCVDDNVLLSEEDLLKKINNIDNRKTIKILWLSNFIQSKGYEDVLELALLEKNRIDNGENQRFKFEFAGKFFRKEEEAHFIEYVKNSQLGDIISYHGIVYGNKKRELFNDADIFILPTRYPNEGQPISILEAMGNGLYIIATNHAGIPDIVENNINGLLINEETIEEIYKKILSLSNGNLKSICINNRNYCLSRFSESNYIDNLSSIFHKVIND